MTLVFAVSVVAAIVAMRPMVALEEASAAERSLDHEPEVGAARHLQFTEQIQR